MDTWTEVEDHQRINQQEHKEHKKFLPLPLQQKNLLFEIHHMVLQSCFSSVNKLYIIVSQLASQPIGILGKLLPDGIRCGGLQDRANCLWEIAV